ncbi:MAG TPA: long-chain fatty acid--CoA ligase [Bacteroidales bacterium]|nr:long-chain fatty acid--CoA ligase [Bacteroidales bacterium]
MEVTRLFDIPARYAQLCPGKKDALAGRDESGWKTYTTEEFVSNCDFVSFGLMKLGVKKGEKVASITFNRPEWNFLDMGIQQLGAIHIPIYPTISDNDYDYILNHAEVSYVFVSGEDLYKRIKRIVEKIPSIKAVYTFRKIEGVPMFDELIEMGKRYQKPSELLAVKDSIRPDDLVTIIYTSGTTGVPKGVMLSHNNIISNLIAVREIPMYGPEHRALSFLPICHIYERTLNYTFLYLGISMYYLGNMALIGDSLKEVNPHVFTTVPRLLEKVYDKIMAKGRALKGVKRAIFFWANAVGLSYEHGKSRRNPIYGFKLFLARKLVFSKWREAFGKNLDIVVSGGAALQPRLSRVFWAAGLRVLEGYGLTETSPVIAVENFGPGGLKFGTVGPPVKNVAVKIAEDGEILVKGPSVMLGYFLDPELTATVIDKDGWFHTGDIGRFEPEGQLKITDRKKMIFKTSFGKYISPQILENKFKESPFIDQIMVVGENQKFAGALVVPDFAHLKSWCNVKGIDYSTNAEMIAKPEIRKRIEQEITTCNKFFGDWERIQKFELLDHEWSVEGGQLSATLKVRRSFVSKSYAEKIDKIFGVTALSN